MSVEILGDPGHGFPKSDIWWQLDMLDFQKV